jgi:Gluconate 2-dehydrogenase subunit 3
MKSNLHRLPSKNSQMLTRRTVLQRISLLLGGALSAELTAGLLGQVTNAGPSVAVDADRRRLLAEVAETIIPTTDTPGAKAAGAEQFVIRVMRDCYRQEEQEKFYAGLAELDADCQTAHGKGFAESDASARQDALAAAAKKNAPFFKVLRELTVAGYFTSEIGATQALEYLPIPGRFEGDLPMKPGQKAWAMY